MPDGLPPSGWLEPDPEEQATLLGSLPPSRQDAGATDSFLLGQGPQERCLWDECVQVLRSNIPVRLQKINDCVGFAFASALEYLQCFQIAHNRSQDAFAEISSESLYG